MLDLMGWYAKIHKNLLIQGNLCYHGIDEIVGFKNRSFGEFSPGQEVPKTIFGFALAIVAA
jgi:hypothetical protein